MLVLVVWQVLLVLIVLEYAFQNSTTLLFYGWLYLGAGPCLLLMTSGILIERARMLHRADEGIWLGGEQLGRKLVPWASLLPPRIQGVSGALGLATLPYSTGLGQRATIHLTGSQLRAVLLDARCPPLRVDPRVARHLGPKPIEG